jgi:hypothetical protein
VPEPLAVLMSKVDGIATTEKVASDDNENTVLRQGSSAIENRKPVGFGPVEVEQDSTL